MTNRKRKFPNIVTMEDTMAQELWDKLRKKGYSDIRINEIFKRQLRMPIEDRIGTYDANETIINELFYMKKELDEELKKRNYPEKERIKILDKYIESYLDGDLFLKEKAKLLPSFDEVLKQVLEKE